MLDCIVIGSGVAGISAALTLQSNGKEFLLFGSTELSSKIYKAEKIHNYPGFTDISGRDFQAALSEQLKAAKIPIQDKKVQGVYAMKDKFVVMTMTQETFESKTVIVAGGVETVKAIEGETEFLGRGVSYCATCDGFLYKGKTIAVLCTSKEYEGEIEHLASFAKKVYLFPLYKGESVNLPNVEKIIKKPSKIVGERRVNGMVFPTKEREETLAVDGVFVLKESYSPSALVAGLETTDGHVAVDRQMRTNLKGCFAAGDCTGRPYQYTKAAGEGNVAAHSVCEYLSQK